MTIKTINPIARAVAMNRRRSATKVVPPKKGRQLQPQKETPKHG